MIKRIDRYILGEVAGPFVGGVIFFIFIFLMFQALRLADFFIIHGVPAGTLAQLAALLSLSFLPTSLPIAFLIGVLVGFGRLSADSELVAMKASGLSLWRMSVPVMALAAVVVALGAALNLEWVPWGERTFKATLIKVGNTKVVSSIKEGTFTSGFFDLLIFADRVNPKTNRLNRVFIYDEREPKNPLTVVARAGEVVPVKTQAGQGSAVLLKLFDGSIHKNDIHANNYSKIDFGEYRLFLKIPETAGGVVSKPQMIPYADLKKRIAETDVSTYEGREWRGEYWRRFAVAFTPMIFVFLGIGYGTVRTRAVRAGAAMVALVVLVVYWGIQAMGTLMVKNGTVPPFFAMQLANFIMLLAAVQAFRKSLW